MENNTGKKKIYWPAKSAILCLIAVPVIYVIVIVSLQFNIQVSNFVGYSIAVFTLGLLAASPLLAIFALMKIYRSNNALGGKGFAIITIVGSSLILLLMIPATALYYNRGGASRIMCGTNLGGLGKAMLIYANDHNDQLPDASKWCDLLVMYADISPEQFICNRSDAKIGESSYAINKEVAGMKMKDIPPDMVLLFETNYGRAKSPRDFDIRNREFAKSSKKLKGKVYKDRWNQVGGPELSTFENHNFDGCNILFADMHVKFEKDLSMLRWKLEGKADFTSPLRHELKSMIPLIKVVLSASVGLLVLFSASVILYKYRKNKNWPAIIFIGLLSGCVGGFFGFLSELLYTFNKFHHTGIIAGSIFGFIVGICYAAILANTPSEIKQQKSFAGYATTMGMPAGIICSTIVHIILMIISAQPMYLGGPNPFGILAGMPFGILAGAIFGSISSLFFRESVSEIRS